MPKFPTADQLGQRIPQNRSVVVQESVDFSGTQSFANALQNYASDAKARQDNLNLQKAQTHWAKKKLEADNAFDQDQDYLTYLDRYGEMLNEGQEEALEMVSSPRMKALLKENIELSKAGGLEQMKDYAFQREKDVGLSTLNQILDDNREIALNATTSADRQGAFDTMSDAIASAQLNSYISSEGAQELRERVAIDAAIGTINVQDLKTQKDMLSKNEGPAKLIPTDTRKDMLEKVNNRLVNEEALTAAEDIRVSGGTLEERRERANKIKDLDVRRAAHAQVTADYNREQDIKSENEYNAFETMAKDVIAGSTPGEVIQQYPDMWDTLTSSQQLALRGMGQNKSGDRAAYHRINMAIAESKRQGYQQFMEEADKLSDTQFKHFSDLFAKGPKETQPLFTMQQDFSRIVGETNLDLGDEEKGQAEMLLREEWELFQSIPGNEGKKPNATEQKEILNRVFDKVVEESFFSGPVYRFELEPNKRNQYDFKKDMEKFAREARRYSESTGNMLTPQIADELFIEMVVSGAIKNWNVQGSSVPGIAMSLPDGSLIDPYGNVTISVPFAPGDVPEVP